MSPTGAFRSTSTVFFALGLLASRDDGGANGTVLVEVARRLGLPGPACRSTILRLRREHLIASRRIGRGTRYEVAPSVASAQRRWSTHFVGGAPAWEGTFSALLHDFPERERARRDALRHAARRHGYGTLRPGVLIAPDDRWSELEDRFTTDEAAGRIVRVELRLLDRDPATLARDVWDLDALAERYRTLTATTRAALARPPGDGETPIARLQRLSQPIYDAVAEDPALPPQLLGPDWPGRHLGRALADVQRALGPAAADEVAAIRSAVTAPRTS